MEKITEKTEKSRPIEVVEDKNPLAVYDHKCKKCGYDKAQLIEIGIWYSDEDDVVRYKCGRCGYVEKAEGKVK